MLFLGTGAAETIPDIFCDCPICTDARNRPQMIRKRSCFQINAENIIDFGPEFSSAAWQYGLEFTKLRNIFITHTHEDHFCSSNFGLISMSLKKPEKPIKVHISEKARKWVENYVKLLSGDSYKHLDLISAFHNKDLEWVPVKPYVEFEVDGMKILAVETEHKVERTEQGECAINYRFTFADGKRLLYASDTGIYTEQNLKALERSALDYLVMEATFGSETNNDPIGHLNGHTFIQMVEMMKKSGIVVDKTQIYATHINHKHDFTHEKYQEFFDNNSTNKITVASDGLRI